MQSGKLTSRFTTLALAIATSACAPHASHAQDAPASPVPAPVEVAPPAPPAVPAGAANPTTTRSKEDRVRAEAARVHDEMARILARTNSDFAKRDGAMKFMWSGRVPSPDTPLVISTQPMDDTAANEWTEDLKVMDKLIREEIARAGGDDPQAMGIKLTMVGRSGPMYVEGAGAVFSAAVNIPLAPIGATSKKDDKPRDPASKWERAKRELNGYPVPIRSVRIEPGKEEGDEESALRFDQAKLDQLVASVSKAMLEAANIRHLPANESVIVTISGIDEGAMPVRLTLKASKGAIDAAAAGKVSAEEFAKQVSRRVG